MARITIDTNVAVVANGKASPEDNRVPSLSCRLAAVEFLNAAFEQHVVLVDFAGAIQEEYRRQLCPSGQPGVGDRFYHAILMSAPSKVERVELPIAPTGQYVALPPGLAASKFDPSDRKFAAMSIQEGVRVANCVDSDWIIHAQILADAGVQMLAVCGDDRQLWFDD